MEFFDKYDTLTRYVYRDLDADEVGSLAECLKSDAELKLLLEELLLAKHQLPKVQFNPAPSTLNNVLQYSRMACAA